MNEEEVKVVKILREIKQEEERHTRQNRIKNILLFMIFLAIIFHALFVAVVTKVHCPALCPTHEWDVHKRCVDQDGNPLENAWVNITSYCGGFYSKQTDENGWANFTGLPEGWYWMEVTYNGYEQHHCGWLNRDIVMVDVFNLVKGYKAGQEG